MPPAGEARAYQPRRALKIRSRRGAQPLGVRPLRIHDARHTWATFALHAGKNIRWVSDQLGHTDPAFTLRVYALALREEETDLSFADFGGPGRPKTAQNGPVRGIRIR
ncbi:MAG: tyrosine-type recombinase/integrase [Myxococcota bacterium]